MSCVSSSDALRIVSRPFECFFFVFLFLFFTSTFLVFPASSPCLCIRVCVCVARRSLLSGRGGIVSIFLFLFRSEHASFTKRLTLYSKQPRLMGGRRSSLDYALSNQTPTAHLVSNRLKHLVSQRLNRWRLSSSNSRQQMALDVALTSGQQMARILKSKKRYSPSVDVVA